MLLKIVRMYEPPIYHTKQAKSPASISYLKTNADSWAKNSQETLELLLDTHFPKNTQVVEDLYLEESLDDQSIDNISY